jgi:hypothetical protein
MAGWLDRAVVVSEAVLVRSEVLSLPFVLGTRFFLRLPLHILRAVCSTSVEGDNVIDHEAGTAIGIPGSLHEFSPGRIATKDPAIGSALHFGEIGIP